MAYPFAINEFQIIFALPILGDFDIRPIRLVVRTPGFHPGNRSSILLWAAKFFLAHSSSG
jgi:hypothetical protein